jgi:hypothetical protein
VVSKYLSVKRMKFSRICHILGSSKAGVLQLVKV